MKEDEAGRAQMIISNGIRAEDQGEATAATKFRLMLGPGFGPPGTEPAAGNVIGEMQLVALLVMLIDPSAVVLTIAASRRN